MKEDFIGIGAWQSEGKITISMPMVGLPSAVSHIRESDQTPIQSLAHWCL